MQVCPKCARLFSDGEAVCPDDSVLLREPSDPRTGLTIGSYQIMGSLGDGGMGKVYRGQHVVIGKDVAIKVLRRQLMDEEQVAKRFLMEAKAASMIRHPNIVDVTDFGRLPDGCSFFVMEFLEGSDLAKVISEEGEIPLYRSVNILTQTCRALEACHDKGIAHRDLKPENIMLIPRKGHRDLVRLAHPGESGPTVEREGEWDEVKILDFGVAKIQEMTTALDQETERQGIVFGSPYYVSPEQAVGESGDYRSDIYSLGIILFEMLTGEVPFDGETARDIMIKHTRDPLPSLRVRRPELNIPAEAELLCDRATSKRPDKRHASAADFLKELSDCFGDVIYGRDIDRYLAVSQRRATSPGIAALDPTSIPSAEAEQANLRDELSGLFNGKHEKVAGITASNLPAVDRAPPLPEPSPDPREEAVAQELKGLFGDED